MHNSIQAYSTLTGLLNDLRYFSVEICFRPASRPCHFSW